LAKSVARILPRGRSSVMAANTDTSFLEDDVPIRRFQRFLAKRNLKMTAARRSVLDAVFATHDHFDADQLMFILRNRGSRVSKATVYRTLSLLVESGLVREMRLTERRHVFEHVFGHSHHDHLVCSQCGRIIEFADEHIENLQKRVCDRMKFEPTHHSLKIYGLCSQCRGGD